MEVFLRRRYGDRVVTPAKVRNFIQVQKDMFAKRVEVSSLPWILNLDTFSGCNLKCPFCPTGTNQMDRKRDRMPIEQARRVIDKVREHVLEIRLYNWGEPFLNPDIFDIVRYAHDAGLFTIINSNLSVRVDDLPRKVVESGLDRLQASVDGLTQASLEIYRRKAKAELVFENVTAIAEERARRGADHPEIDLAFLVFRHNEHELGQLEAKRRQIGADAFFPRRAFIYEESWIPEHPDFQPLRDVFTGTCDFLYSELTIEATGAVSPCCSNMSEKWDVGVFKDIADTQAFWNGPKYRAMRAFHAGPEAVRKSGCGGETLCHHCDFVKHPNMPEGRLSPLPPSFQAEGMTYDHGLDKMHTRTLV